MSASNVASNLQVVSLYEQGMSPEEIQMACKEDSVPLELEAIKLALYNGSALYRSRVKAQEEDFTDDDYQLSGKILKNLMLSAESDYVKLRAIIRLRDEKKGRLEKKGMNINFSMTLVNEKLASEKAIQAAREKVIDIDPKHKHLKEIAA